MSGGSGEPGWGGPEPPRRPQQGEPPAGGGEWTPPGGQPQPPSWGGQPQPPSWGGQPQPPSWGGQPWQPPPPRRGAPVWVVVLVGVLALVVGLGVGGAIGFVAGMGSQLAEDLATPSVGPDAERAGGPLTAAHDVGDLTVEDVVVERDFAGDFEARATVTNRSPETYPGGAIEIRLLRDDDEVGSVSGYVPPLGVGQTEEVALWGFDPYVEDVDGVEILAD